MNISSSQRSIPQAGTSLVPKTGNAPENSPKEPTDTMTWSDAAGVAAVPALMTGVILGTGLVANHFLGDAVGTAVGVATGTALCAGYAKATGRNVKLSVLHGLTLGVTSAQLANLDFSTGIKTAGIVATMGVVGGLAAHQACSR